MRDTCFSAGRLRTDSGWEGRSAWGQAEDLMHSSVLRLGGQKDTTHLPGLKGKAE